MLKHVCIVVGIVLACSSVNAENILVLFTAPVKSHVGAFQPLVEELANRGHDVTVVTAFPRSKPLKNYREIVFQDTLPPRNSSNMNFFQMHQGNAFFTALLIWSVFSSSCEKLINQPSIQQLIHEDNKQYDLIIYEAFVSECLYGLIHKHKAPSIQIFPNTVSSFVSDPKGNPNTLSYIPDMLSGSVSVGFAERLSAVLRVVFLRTIRQFLLLPKFESVMREHFKDPSLPSIEEIDRNSSVLFLHTHPLFNYPRPLTPNTIEVAGLHIKATNKLPQDLKSFMDSASHGVIYFSLGSNVRAIDMPGDMKEAILKSFSKLKQRVLWKWEDDNLPGQPENVRLGKWFPQHDVLAHPNVKLFITHGGLMSIQEATYFGVPLIAIPVMGDQYYNALRAQHLGLAALLHISNITEKSLDSALNEVLHEPRYQERAKELSKIFRDQTETPLERAVYWVEYVIRHQGAPHLMSGALKLNTVEYYLLDVIAVIVFVTFVAFFIMFKITNVFLKRIFRRQNITKTKNKKRE